MISMHRRQSSTSPGKPRGMVLILVLIVIAMLALAAYTYMEVMLAEHEAAILHGRKIQAYALADSGLEAARLFLAQELAAQQDAGGHYDNPERFRGMLVMDEGTPYERGRFTLVAPMQEEEGTAAGIRFGLEDESSRLNLNALVELDKKLAGSGRSLLLGLPGMTEEIADAILDWIDEDDETREYGAEIDEYSGYDPPYAPKNGPLETVEELLLVRGITPWLLFGSDANRNVMTDLHEVELQGLSGVDDSDGSMSRGWSTYLTLYSMESNLNPDGEPKIDVNQDDLQALYDATEEIGGAQWATFIVAYRQNGPFTGNSSAPPAPLAGQLDMEQPSKAKFQTILDLIGAKVQVKFKGSDTNTLLDSPFVAGPAMNAYLPKLMENFAATTQHPLPGRININQAPRAILLGIPGMTEEIADRILAERVAEPEESQAHRNYETWLLSEGVVTIQEMKQMIPFVTGRGAVFRAQAVGYFEEGGPSARVEAVFDTTGEAPRQLFWRDLSHLGRGYSLETLGVGY